VSTEREALTKPAIAVDDFLTEAAAELTELVGVHAVRRFEVIDRTTGGPVCTRDGVRAEPAFQDDQATRKVFLTDPSTTALASEG